MLDETCPQIWTGAAIECNEPETCSSHVKVPHSFWSLKNFCEPEPPPFKCVLLLEWSICKWLPNIFSLWVVLFCAREETIVNKPLIKVPERMIRCMSKWLNHRHWNLIFHLNIIIIVVVVDDVCVAVWANVWCISDSTVWYSSWESIRLL